MSEIKMEAIRFLQDGVPMYLAAPKMHDLLEKCEVDEWKPHLKEDDFKNKEDYLYKQGYQRKPSERRKKQISRYLQGQEAFLPASIILSLRSKSVNFTPHGKDDNSGIVTIKENEKFFILDGQHRFAGLKYAIQEDEVLELLDYPVPITILTCEDKKKEIEQFALINRTQKVVRTELADRLIEFLRRSGIIRENIPALNLKDWKSRAVRIAEKVNNDPKSPWYNRIVKPNASKNDFAVAGESEFTKSLKNFLSSEFGRKKGNNDDYAIEIINAYWNALKKLMPDSFKAPSKYVIQKTTGFHSWNSILPTVLHECTLAYHDFKTVDNLIQIVKRVESDMISSEFWESGNKEGAPSYVGMGPIKQLADELQEMIREP